NAAPGGPVIAHNGRRSTLPLPASSPAGSIATQFDGSVRRLLVWPMPGSRSSAAPSVLLGSSLPPIAVPVARHGRRRSGMVSSLAALLSMLENIAQRLSRLWARVANLNELPGNSAFCLRRLTKIGFLYIQLPTSDERISREKHS